MHDQACALRFHCRQGCSTQVVQRPSAAHGDVLESVLVQCSGKCERRVRAPWVAAVREALDADAVDRVNDR